MFTLEDIRAAVKATLDKRAAAAQSADDIIATVTAENRSDLTPEETTKLAEARDAVKAIDADLAGLNQRLTTAEAEERAKQEAAALAARLPVDLRGTAAGTPVIVRSEPTTYGPGSGHSYFLDLASATLRRGADVAAAEARLNKHRTEMDVELQAREGRRDAMSAKEIREAFGAESPFEKRTNPNRTDGTGGYFVPPLWLVDEYLPLLRAGRPFANQCRNLPLPSGTDSINIPKVATGTTTAIQTADGAAVSSTDMTDSAINAPVRTIAGQQDVGMQLLDQSPIAFDQVIFTDLIADYNRNVDRQCLNGTGSSGQVTGVTVVSGTGSVTYTDGSPTGPELFAPLAQAVSGLAQNRFTIDGVKYFMHPRRWFWLAASLDTTNRPLVTPANMAPMNPAMVASPGAEGFVGNSVFGPPVFIDANITTSDTTGGGSGQDVIIASKTDDLYLFEGTLRTRVLTEVLSGTLQVRFQVYNYVAFLPDRYLKATYIVTGSGLAAPSGF